MLLPCSCAHPPCLPHVAQSTQGQGTRGTSVFFTKFLAKMRKNIKLAFSLPNRKQPTKGKHYTRTELAEMFANGQPLSLEQHKRLFGKSIPDAKPESNSRKQFLDKMQSRFHGEQNAQS